MKSATHELCRFVGRAATDDPDVRAAFASDFGGVVRAVPALVVCAGSEEDVVRTLLASREYQVPVTVRGSGHSCSGLSVGGGILLLNRARGRAEEIRVEAGTLETSARNPWRAVEAFANRAGLAMPVLGDWLALTVGGTLSVGGYGARSIVAGSQLDQVQRLRLVLPDGTARWCAPDQDPELFQLSLGALGSIGVIERVMLRTRPHRRWTVIRTHRAPRLGDLARALEWMNGWDGPWPDLFYYTGKRNRVVFGFDTDGPAGSPRGAIPEPLLRERPTSTIVLPRYPWLSHLGVAAWLAAFPRSRRLWSDYLLPPEGLGGFLARVEELAGRGAFAGCLRTVYLLAARSPPRPVELPFEAGGGKREPSLRFGIGLYSMIPRRDDRGLFQVRTALRETLEHCLALGGRPYLYGWHELQASEVRELYGLSYDRLLSLRRALDPDGLFQPGPTALG